MKRTFAALIAAVLLLSIVVVSFADGETIITTVVPDVVQTPEYVLSIPANLGIEYQCNDFILGNVTATAVNCIKPGDCLWVSVTWTDFVCAETTTTIPLALSTYDGFAEATFMTNGGFLTFTADESGAFTGGYVISGSISADAWRAASPGSYAARVVFTSGIA